MPLWQTFPQAVAILSRITPDNLRVASFDPIVGPSFLVLHGADYDTIDLLDDLFAVRKRIVEQTFGLTFEEALTAGRGREYLRHDEQNPTVEQVLADRFGDPRRFAGLSLEQADRVWRAEAEAALVRSVAA